MTKNTEDALKTLTNNSLAKIQNDKYDIMEIKNKIRLEKRSSWLDLTIGNKEKSEGGIEKVHQHSNGNSYFHITQSYYNNVISGTQPTADVPIVHGDMLYTNPDGMKTLGHMRFWDMSTTKDDDELIVNGGFPKTGLSGRWEDLEYLIENSRFKEGGTLYKGGKGGDWKTYPPLDEMECSASYGGNDSHNGRYTCGQSAGACVGYVHNESWGKCAPGPPGDRAAAEGEACNFHHSSLHAHGEGKPIYQLCGAEAPRCDMWGNQTSGKCVKIEIMDNYHPNKNVTHGRKKDYTTLYQCPLGMNGPGCNNQTGGVASRQGTDPKCKIGYYLYCYGDPNPPEDRRTYSSKYPDEEGYPVWSSMLDNGRGWAAGGSDENQWVILYLGIPRNVRRIITQGRSDHAQYVTEYKVQYKEKEEDTWIDVKNIQGSLIFTGNRSYGDENVSNELQVPVFASYIKIIPVSWQGHITMRVGVDGNVPEGKSGIVAYGGTSVDVDSEYTTTMSSSGSTLKEWSDNVVKKTLALSAAAASCTDDEGWQAQAPRLCTNGAPGQSNFNSCTAKEDMWIDLKTNPVLRHFVEAWKGEEMQPLSVSKYMTSPNLINNPNGIGWLRIPTTPTNLLRGTWGSEPGDANHSNNYPREKNVDYNIDGSHLLTMLVVRKFSSDESKKIYDALQNQTDINPPRDQKTVQGRNFIFTREGHISFIPPGGTQADQIKYLNPYINIEHDIIDGQDEAGGKTNSASLSKSDPLHIDSEQTNTMAGNGINGIGKFSGYPLGRKGIELIYAMGPKVVMNRALNYILYTPADENDLIDTETKFVDNDKALESIGRSRYYLLYNPIHTIDFRRFFQSHLQVNAVGKEFPDSVLGYTKPSVSTPYSAPSTKVHDPAGCRDYIEVPAYKTIIAKYCNAFQVTGLLNGSGKRHVKHYADPLCPFAMGSDSSFHAFVTNSNVTHQSTREDYYRLKRSSSAYYSVVVGNDRMDAAHRNSLFTSQIWACPGHGATSTESQENDNIQGWMLESKMLEPDGKSFIKDIVNSIVNESSFAIEGKKRSISRIPSYKTADDDTLQKMTSSELKEYLTSDSEKWGGPICANPVTQINVCSSTVTVGGNVNNSSTEQTNICGGGGATEEDEEAEAAAATAAAAADAGTVTDPDESKLECQKLTKVPKCAKYGIPDSDAVDKIIDGKTIWTACCLHSNGIDMIDCREEENGSCETVSGTMVNPPEEGSTQQGVTAATLSTSLSNLSTRINKAANVAETAKNAYPDDTSIIEKAELVISTTNELITTVDSIRSEIETLDTTGRKVTVERSIGTLSDNVIDLEVIEQDLVKIIKDNYLFGQKKMYVLGAGGAIVLLIILFLFMRGGKKGGGGGGGPYYGGQMGPRGPPQY